MFGKNQRTTYQSILRIVLIALACQFTSTALAAPWSTSKVNTTDSVRIEALGKSYSRILVASPTVGGEYRAAIERNTAVRISRNAKGQSNAISYIGAFGDQNRMSQVEIESKLKSAKIDGIIVIDMHGKLKEQWKSKDVLDLTSIGLDSIAADYKDIPLNERDSSKRNIHAYVALFDYTTRKIMWEAEITINVVRSRADGAHVAEYIAKQVGLSLLNRGLLGAKSE